jgi:putative DNA methylase
MSDRPRVLIEDWLPVAELGIESVRERANARDLSPIVSVHVWWARRPLVASAGVIATSLLPTWTEPLSAEFLDDSELSSLEEYRGWVLRLCGILGDPLAAAQRQEAAHVAGSRTKENPFDYPPAHKISPTVADLDLLSRILQYTWGAAPCVIDPTAGGGSIPFAAVRLGIAATANDLNAVAASTLRATVEIPARFGHELMTHLLPLGTLLASRLESRLIKYFPPASDAEHPTNYLFARTVTCPRTGKTVPLAPNWWLSKAPGKEVGVRLITELNGRELDEVEFELVTGNKAGSFLDKGTVGGGDGVSPWDGLIIDGDYIKAEAQAGRMGSVLYAIVAKQGRSRIFRAPTKADGAGLEMAALDLAEQREHWEAIGVLPTESIPQGNKTREPLNYGMNRWADMFSERQLLVHGAFVEELAILASELVTTVPDEDERRAVLGVLGLMQGKALNWNSTLASWNVLAQGTRSTFDRHDFAFKWTFSEFEGATDLWKWVLTNQMPRAVGGVVQLLRPSDAGELFGQAPAMPSVTVMAGNGADLSTVASGTQTLVCIDPPYYDNVMYGELADFFSVWEARTVGRFWPDLYQEGALSDVKNEAVANPARFADAGRRRKELATADYEAKMTAVFAECHRILRDDGVLTVMFTHKRAEAWDTLGMALMESGFTVETSWPVATEKTQSLHQHNLNSAASTIMLVCRKRASSTSAATYFEDVEGDVRAAARDALARFSAFGIEGVDLLLSTYGPALSVISSSWPVYSSEADPITGKSRLLRPEEALDAARGELVRLQRQRLIGRAAQLDPITDFVLLSWEIFKAREFPFDEARRLALAVGGLDVDDLVRAKVVEKKSGTVVLTPPSQRVRRHADQEAELPGIYLEAQAFPVMIDALHTAMHLVDEDGPAAAKAWLDRVGLTDDQRFQAALQGLVNAMPRSKTKDKWDIPEAEWLDAICFYFPDVTVPEARTAVDQAQQTQLDFEV